MKRTPEETHHWSLTKERIDWELKEYYRTCTNQEYAAAIIGAFKETQSRTPRRDYLIRIKELNLLACFAKRRGAT